MNEATLHYIEDVRMCQVMFWRKVQSTGNDLAILATEVSFNEDTFKAGEAAVTLRPGNERSSPGWRMLAHLTLRIP